ncbi:ECF-type sigma factor [Paludisphaera rhizosphaerae]|uniref:ECF-type sigma factor n=1 Tax=Paludisphaera rhizosphaerae TaxID=2711216 RepID=UPI0013EAE596|nr:ECF-type sigma factor [Paludisphaera rhizosphaerae]
MSSDGSITRLIGPLKEGDRETTRRLWDVYFDRLARLAQARLRGVARGAADEEDVVVSVFDSFFRRAEEGRFPQLRDRDDLWKMLFVLTVRKAINRVQHEGRQSRGGGRVRSLSELDDLDAFAPPALEPSPEIAAQMTEECRILLDRLGDPALRAVAVWKMEGYTNREIAEKLDCVEQTVERKLKSIRRIWAAEDSS